MSIKFKHYNPNKDYNKVSNFLKRTFHDYYHIENWMEPRWEYMNYHPYINNFDISKIGLWEDGDQIVGVVHPEHALGVVYFQVDPEYQYLTKEMLEYAKNNLFRIKETHKEIIVYANEYQKKLIEILVNNNFKKIDGYSESMSIFEMPENFDINIPEGFKIKSLEKDNNLKKIDRVLWRGFNHKGEPEYDIESRKFMQSAPNFRKDLNIVIEAPDGNFVSYSGIFYEKENNYSYVEPVATDPDYRRMGLGRAAVLECIRRTKVMGAKYAYVGSSMDFYLSFGFKPIYKLYAYKKSL